MNGARLHPLSEYMKLVKHDCVKAALSGIKVSDAPFQYKVAITMLKCGLAPLYYIIVRVLLKGGVV